MSKSLRKMKRKPKTKRKTMKRKYKGGTYYSYNNTPLRFTSSSSQIGGKFTLNTKDTLFPQEAVNAARSLGYNSSSNSMNGYYPSVNPDPTVQPINKSYMLL